MRIHLEAMHEDGTIAAQEDVWVPNPGPMREQSRDAWQRLILSHVDDLVARAESG